MNYIISTVTAIAIALVGALGGWLSGEKVFNKQPEQFVGAFSDTFISLQLATDPTNGECLTTDGINNAWGTCGTGGGGSGGGTWSTTTSQVASRLINYPNNTTDIVVIGANATTSAEYWFDPNTQRAFLLGNVGIGTTSPYSTLSVVGGVVARNFIATSTTATSTFAGDITVSGRVETTEIKALSSAGLLISGNSYTPVASFGAGGGTGVTFTGGVIGYGTHTNYGVLTVPSLSATSTTATSTFSGDVDMSSGRVKMKRYPAFSFPTGINTATTTTATTTIAVGTAFVPEQYTSGECFTGSGTIGYRLTDGTNAMDYELATSTVSRLAITTNNTFQVGEKRFIEIGPITASYLSCSFEVTQHY